VVKEILNFEGIKVVVIGDVMLDRYLRGSVERISPEAPVPVLEKATYENCLGGAANVALNIKSLGAEPFLFGVIGNEEDGEILKSCLKLQHIKSDYLIKDVSRVTTVKTRIIADKQHLLRVDKEDRHDIIGTVEDQCIAALEQLLLAEQIDIAIFQDYNKGFLKNTFIQRVRALFSGKKIPYIVDPKKENFWEYQNAEIFKPNLKEVKEALGETGQGLKEYLQWASKEIKNRLKVQKVIITLASDGIYSDSDEGCQILPTKEIKVRDVCGAGDAVISILALSEALKLSIPQMMKLSNLAGGIVCEKNGVAPVTITELNEENSSLE